MAFSNGGAAKPRHQGVGEALQLCTAVVRRVVILQRQMETRPRLTGRSKNKTQERRKSALYYEAVTFMVNGPAPPCC